MLGARSETGNAELDVLVEEIADLQPLPPIAAQVLQIAEGDHFSAHELAQAISSDPALTARVLRVANSAYYGFPRRIHTIRDAVVLLGFRQIRSTVMAACAIRSMPSYETVDPEVFWRHALTVGLLAEAIARETGAHQEQAFTAGMLHNIGRLALDQARPDDFRAAVRLAASDGVSVREAERRLLGFTDAEVGGALAMRWHFPGDLAMAIARHAGEPHSACDPGGLVTIVRRARAFAARHGVTDGVELADAGDAQETASPSSPARPSSDAYAGTMAVMGAEDRSPDPDQAHQPGGQGRPEGPDEELQTLIARLGGMEAVIDRAAAFVEHAAAGP